MSSASPSRRPSPGSPRSAPLSGANPGSSPRDSATPRRSAAHLSGRARGSARRSGARRSRVSSSRTAVASGAGTVTCWPAASAWCRASSSPVCSAARRRPTESSWMCPSRQAPRVSTRRASFSGSPAWTARSPRAPSPGWPPPPGPCPAALARRRAREIVFAARLARAFAPREEILALARPDTIVCRCEDVSLGRLLPATSLREMKLHTRAGMGSCQGRVCGSALSVLRGLPPDSVRSPLVPVPIGVLADEGLGATASGAGAAPAPAPRSA